MEDQARNFILLFTSILWEALPFIVLGAVIAGILEELVPQELITRLVPRTRILAIAVSLALLLGRSLAQPIRRLADAAAAVSAFDFSGTRRPGGSPLRELDAAGQAWDRMLGALRRKYGWMMAVVNLFARVAGRFDKRAYIELTVEGPVTT